MYKTTNQLENLVTQAFGLKPVKSSKLKCYLFLRLGLGMWLMKHLSKKHF